MLHHLAVDGEKPRRSAQERAQVTARRGARADRIFRGAPKLVD